MKKELIQYILLKMDKEITTIREFVTFAYEILGKKNKQVSNLYRFISKPDSLGEQQILDIKKAASQCFSTITQWNDFTGKNFIQYKTGYLSLKDLERKCAKKPDDLKVFNEYMEVIRALYFDIQKNLTEFISKLHLEEGSPEAEFMSSLFNEVGGEIVSVIKDGGNTQDVASLLPKVFEMVKSGKILEVMEKLKDGTVKISKILKAFAVLVEEYENIPE